MPPQVPTQVPMPRNHPSVADPNFICIEPPTTSLSYFLTTPRLFQTLFSLLSDRIISPSYPLGAQGYLARRQPLFHDLPDLRCYIQSFPLLKQNKFVSVSLETMCLGSFTKELYHPRPGAPSRGRGDKRKRAPMKRVLKQCMVQTVELHCDDPGHEMHETLYVPPRFPSV